ncbi:outer membrane protein assembly factor BamE (lipoprotein component of BamABCDE complex) [Polymorphobacter multimanifer]|uniref:Outer membrane protein assembly factor BamE (Lipoprotein component of BamABCDE complex) n=2 Tax=Polymorphobacter multimanifer TaxID=1070431 RepID=A0A841LH47_9SPHN|nr:outer membrane protein assembly factor BamE [Polymorphobacter multimanifer]MBB6228522.1 outer membrane protein assembly factor BamE (lipoprotein component of BamABCDE complex) [Polymorphobacter multimanifer]
MRKVHVAMMVGAALLASGCSRVVASQGYLIDETLLTSIQPGVDNKQSVERTLGRPTLASQFDEKEWYYITRNTGQYAFIQPKVQSQTILVVAFDDDGNVATVERRGMEKIANVSIEGDSTPTLGRKTGLLEDIFGNIGAVGAGAPGGPGGPGGGGPNGGGRQ